MRPKSHGHLIPECLTGAVGEIIGSTTDNVRRKVIGLRDPQFLRPEKWLDEHDAILDHRNQRLVPFLDYSPEIRRVIYTTNAVESLNRVIRKAIEVPLAIYIDLVLSKQRIFEIYLNIAEWGPEGTFGIGAVRSSSTLPSRSGFPASRSRRTMRPGCH